MKALNELLIKARPIINAVGLEKAAGLPNNTLGRHYRWADGLPHGQPCSPNHFAPIVRALCEVFGSIEVAGWTVQADRTFFVCVKGIPDRAIKAKEIKAETSSTFEYKVEQWRCIVDDIDFKDFFTNNEMNKIIIIAQNPERTKAVARAVFSAQPKHHIISNIPAIVVYISPVKPEISKITQYRQFDETVFYSLKSIQDFCKSLDLQFDANEFKRLYYDTAFKRLNKKYQEKKQEPSFETLTNQDIQEFIEFLKITDDIEDIELLKDIF